MDRPAPAASRPAPLRASRRIRAGRIAIAGLAAAAFALSGCTTQAAEDDGPSRKEVAPGYLAQAASSAKGGGELTVQLDYDTAEVGGLDPQAAATARSWMIEGLAYQTLTTIDEKLGVAPELATSWTTPDDRTYVFELATDAVFSNGRAMTAADVVGSLQRLAGGATTWTGQLGPVDSVEATGEHEVTVRLKSPYAPFLAALANTPAAILPMQEIDAGSLDITKEMVGTGPLMSTAHRQDEEWTFEPNPHSPDAGDLGFSKLTLDIVTDESARTAAIRNGNADLAVLGSPDAADLLASSKKATTVGQQNTDFYYLVINSVAGNEALKDRDVRFAINQAIDRDAIDELALGGASEPSGVTPAPLPDACSAAKLPSAGHDIAAAKKVIDERGGLKLDLLTYTDEPALAQMAQVVQQNLAEIGVTVSIEQSDFASYSDKVFADPSDFDLALNWFAGYADPSMVSTWWNPPVAGFSKVFMTGSDDLTGLIEEGYTTENGSARAKVFTDLCRTADRESEMVPLVLRPTTLAWNTDQLSPTIGSKEGYGNFLRYITQFRAA